MKDFIGKHKTAVRLSVIGMVFLLLFIAALVRFAPTLGYADLNKAEPIRKENQLYYNSLSRRDQFLYDALIGAIDDFAEYTGEVRYVYASADFSRVVQCIICDHPEYFYVDFDRIESYVSRTHTKVKLAYYESREVAMRMSEELGAAVDGVLAALPEGSGDFETELYLHDYLVRNCGYLTGFEGQSYLANTAYGAICQREAYCDGYALAFKLLMNRAGLFCCPVSGYANDLPHMWNLVYIGERFYHVDVTWDDADRPDAQEMLFHGYFNLSTEAISRSHILTDGDILPPADDATDYYRTIGQSAANADELGQILYRALTGAAAAGRNYIELALDYEGAADDLDALYRAAVKRINSEGNYTFLEAYRKHPCSENQSFQNIEIYYEVNQ